jgi:asparagine synthase (glutamine-hydrolysing)
MCGLLFVKAREGINRELVAAALQKQKWRGPDAEGVQQFGDVFLAHQRLSVLDLSHAADQPMASRCGRYIILFNGEIYNHNELRRRLGLTCRTGCDTETIVEGFASYGTDIFDLLDGMFALVVVDIRSGEWWAARDRFGIKPLFIYETGGTVVLSSETVSIRALVPCTVSSDAIEEWKLIRRPVPGYTYFTEISEVLPGAILHNGRTVGRLSIAPRLQSVADFDQAAIETLLTESVRDHELSDVNNVCLLSGGIDSSIIAALSTAQRAYTVGLPHNNEFDAAAETAAQLGKELVKVEVSEQALMDSWRTLISLRGEPLSVPNEGLIYMVCKAMQPSEKVVLTGEGADELFFGYDRIFRSAATEEVPFTRDDFYRQYCYALNPNRAPRLVSLIDDLWRDKSNIEFVEDFFLAVHLPGLLRRMDGASMAASKEARVPFVAMQLARYMYRRPVTTKIDAHASKIPLRRFAEHLNLHGALNRPKIGFSSTINKQVGRNDEYSFFQNYNLEVLGWL